MGRLDILKQENNQNISNSYKSDFNFLEYEIDDENTINEISQKEEEIIRTAKQIARKSLDLGRMLYETQQLLSNYKSGIFAAWFTYMGMDKNFVYREINRWELFQKYKNPQIAEASIRTLDFIKKNEELEENKVIEILEEPKKAPEVIKEIKEEKQVVSKSKEEQVEEIEEQIEKLYKKIEILEKKKEEINSF